METKQKFKIPGEVFVVLGIIVVLGLAIFLAIKHDRIARAEVDGAYACAYESKAADGSDTSITVSIVFDAKEGTFQELWNTSVFGTGTYTVDGKTISTVISATGEHDAETVRYTVEGDVLIPLDYIYEGKVPSGDKFAAQFTMEDKAGTKSTLDFNEDGTFKIVTISGTTSSEVKGKYERKGDYIYRTKEDGGALTPYYIYGKQLVGAFYEKSADAVAETEAEQ